MTAVAAPTVRSQFYLLATGRIAATVLQAVTLALLAREAGAATFGMATAIVGAAQASLVVADLGLTPGLLRARARDGEQHLVRPLLSLNHRMSCALGLAWLAVLGSAAQLTGRSAYLVLLPVALWVAMEKETEAWLMVPLADGHTQDIARSLVVRRLPPALAVVAAPVAGIDPLLAYAGGLGVGGVLGTVWVVRRVAPRVPADGGAGVRPLLRLGLPLWLASLAHYARSLDVLVVGWASTPTTAGVYAAPSRLTGPLSLLPSSIAQMVLPAAARGDRDALRMLGRALTTVLGGMVALFVVLGLLAEPLLRIGLGPEFAGAAGALRLVLVGLVFLGLASSLLSLLQARGDEWAVTWACVAATAAGLPALAIGAATAGATGAAAGMALSYAVQLALLAARAWWIRSRLWAG